MTTHRTDNNHTDPTRARAGRRDDQDAREVEQDARQVEQDAREVEQDGRGVAQDAREHRLVKLFAAWRIGQVGRVTARALNSTYQRELLARAAEALSRSRQRLDRAGNDSDRAETGATREQTERERAPGSEARDRRFDE